jgi:predicted nuclease with TOPRIM domain
MFTGDTELIASVNRFRGWVASAEAMATKYSAPPEPIDFESTKKTVKDKKLVESLETFYKSAKPAPKTYEWLAEEKVDALKQIEEARSREAFTAELIADAEQEISFLKENRTTRDMSYTQMAEAYPELADEAEDEIDNREWFKDYIIK